MMQDTVIEQLQSEWLHRNRHNRRWIIVETGEGYEVHEHTADGVAPPSRYANKRLAASRLLQLLKIGPVAPQSHPEEICVGVIGYDQ